MTSQDHGSFLNNQEDILAGLEINPATTYHAENNINCFDDYTQHKLYIELATTRSNQGTTGTSPAVNRQPYSSIRQ
ncbi:hypothetical protein E5D57_002608 [Metarhizium anisopliae]|nr:hypothetical protein E5D57_002608 [Metarhizium anisopliae]